MYARQWTCDPDDCVQEAFIRLASVDRPVNPTAWLYQVVRRQAINLARSRRRRSNRESSAARPEADSTRPDAKLQQAEEFQTLQAKLDSLDESHRELVVLRIWTGLTWEQISELTQTPLSTAHRRFNDAIAQLKAILETNLVD